MNKFRHGTIVTGSPGSYQYLLSALTDLLKGKPKDFEVFHLGEQLKREGLKIGLSKNRITSDWIKIHKEILT